MQPLIFLASDHGGFPLKEKIYNFLKEKYKVLDLGPAKFDSADDYPDYGFKLGKKVSQEKGSLGILICRSGIGMSIVANKVKGIRAALCLSPHQAHLARQHNDANVLVLAADFTNFKKTQTIINEFLKTNFSQEERHQRRLEKILKFENNL